MFSIAAKMMRLKCKYEIRFLFLFFLFGNSAWEINAERDNPKCRLAFMNYLDTDVGSCSRRLNLGSITSMWRIPLLAL